MVSRNVAYHVAYLVLLGAVALVAVVVALAIEFEQRLGARLAYKHLNASIRKVLGMWQVMCMQSKNTRYI